jgi:hypothetical protein
MLRLFGVPSEIHGNISWGSDPLKIEFCACSVTLFPADFSKSHQIHWNIFSSMFVFVVILAKST